MGKYLSYLFLYAEALLSAVTVPDPQFKEEIIILKKDVPSPINPPAGCHFPIRCPNKKDECERVCPPLRDVGKKRSVACHLTPLSDC